MKQVAIIGAGAAGCFCAVELARKHPDWQISVYEAGRVPMAKLALTGGGRCNLTNSFREVSSLKEVYPRGEKLMKRALARFSQNDTIAWFEKEGVRLLVQPDQCVFPVSQDAMQIVRTLERLMRDSGVRLYCGSKIASVRAAESGYELVLTSGSAVRADAVVMAAGGCSQKTLQAMLPSDIEITPTLPSLFTFKIDDTALRSLMGAVVEEAVLGIAGTSFRSRGALLITDWGVSGPATLKLSSHAARYLAEHSYCAELLINWSGGSEANVREWLSAAATANPKKLVCNIHPSYLTERVWKYLLQKTGLRDDLRWAELGGKGFNKLVGVLTADSCRIAGRAAFKEEFVTCGGVALSEVNINTLESKKYSGLYFAGEVLDVDAVTGGFNLQAAWSMAKTVVDAML